MTAGLQGETMGNPAISHKTKLTLYAGELKALAQKLGRSTPTVSRLISGDRPSKTLAAELKRVTGFEPEQLDVSPFKRPEGSEVPRFLAA